jgi:hypothetical protein
MKKTAMLIGLIALLVITVVSAVPTIDYKARCDIVMPATEYRQERVFHGIGIWGRMSDGSLICFTPGRISHKENVVSPPVVLEEPVCEITTVCEDPVCVDEETDVCKTWNYEESCADPVCNWVETTCHEWNYEKVCADPVCHSDSTTVWHKNNNDGQACHSHNHQNCHSHIVEIQHCAEPVCDCVKTTCHEWNHEKVCDEPVCENEPTTCAVWGIEQVCEEPVCTTHNSCDV